MIYIISITLYIIVATRMFVRKSTNSTSLLPVSGVSPTKKVHRKEHKLFYPNLDLNSLEMLLHTVNKVSFSF